MIDSMAARREKKDEIDRCIEYDAFITFLS